MELEVQWNDEWFYKRSKGYWKNKENQRKWLEQFAAKMKIRGPKEWGKLTQEQIELAGGISLLSEFKFSIFSMLSSSFPGVCLRRHSLIFPEVNWKREWFRTHKKYSVDYWSAYENQRSFMEKLMRQHRLNSALNWKRVTLSSIRKAGGKVSLLTYFSKSGGPFGKI